MINWSADKLIKRVPNLGSVIHILYNDLVIKRTILYFNINLIIQNPRSFMLAKYEDKVSFEKR